MSEPAGVIVLVSLSVDSAGHPFEVDVWKSDFHPVIRFPDALAPWFARLSSRSPTDFAAVCAGSDQLSLFAPPTGAMRPVLELRRFEAAAMRPAEAADRR